MCMLCVDRAKGKLTLEESFRNLFELKESIGEEHYNQVISELIIDSANDNIEFSPDVLKDVTNQEIDAMLDFWLNDSISWMDIV